MQDTVIGVLKETRPGERRVILLPPEVRTLCSAGFPVLVEHDAGAACGAQDDDYRSAGADIASRTQVWNEASLVIKFKAPGDPEYEYLRPSLHIGAYLHAEGNVPLTAALCRSGATAWAFEFFKTPDGIFPMSLADSEIAGKLAVLYGAYHLQAHLGGAGILLADIVGAPPAKVVVIGYGNAGGAAARTAAALGAAVTVFGRDPVRLRRFQATVPSAVSCMVYEANTFASAVADADLVVGAVQISTYDTPALVDEDLLRQMRPGSMIVDVTCGYGPGYLPTFPSATTFEQPVTDRNGILHCKIDILPAAVPRTTTAAVSPLIQPYIQDLARCTGAQAEGSICHQGLVVTAGRVVHPEVRRHMIAAGRKDLCDG